MPQIGKNDHQLPAAVRESFSERPSNLDSMDEDSEVSKMVSLETFNSSEGETNTYAAIIFTRVLTYRQKIDCCSRACRIRTERRGVGI